MVLERSLNIFEIRSPYMYTMRMCREDQEGEIRDYNNMYKLDICSLLIVV